MENHEYKEVEYQNRIQDLKKKTEILKEQKEINQTLETNLIGFYHKIEDANVTAKELNRRIYFKPFVATLNLMSSSKQRKTSSENLVMVKVVNQEDGWINYWNLDKFENRFILMQETIDYFFASNSLNYDQSNDPFWDPKEFYLYGQGICMLKSVLYKLHMDLKIGVLGYQGDIGEIGIKLLPVDDDGELIDEDDEEAEIEVPDDLMERNLSCHFKVEFTKFTFFNIDEIINKKFYLSYTVMTSNGLETYRTPNYIIKNNNVNIFYSQFINLEKVDLEIIDYYLYTNLEVKLYIDEIEQVEMLGKGELPILKKTTTSSKKKQNKKKEQEFIAMSNRSLLKMDDYLGEKTESRKSKVCKIW